MTIYLKDDFDFDFGIFISKISMVNTKISSTVETFSKSLEQIEEESKIDDEIEEDLGSVEIPEELSKSLYELSENLKHQVFFNSLAISIYSFFEFSLVEYCRMIDIYLSTSKPFDEYKEKGLEKAKQYLKDNFNIDFGSVTFWDDLSKFQKIRNKIVHNNANIILDFSKPLEEQQDYDVISSMSDYIEITSVGYIFIKSFDYLNDTKNKVVELINDIIERTREDVKKKNNSN